MDHVYAFTYNSFIEENDAATISIHKTRGGAKAAMKKHKFDKRVEYDKLYGEDADVPEFGFFEHWDVVKRKIEE